MAGGGADIWGVSDQFHFVYQAVDGDLEIVARVESIEFMHRWSKAGVMIREQLTPGLPRLHARKRGEGLGVSATTASEGISIHTGTTDEPSRLGEADAKRRHVHRVSVIRWLELEVVGSDTIAMARQVYVGLAVTSHRPGTIATALSPTSWSRPYAGE